MEQLIYQFCPRCNGTGSSLKHPDRDCAWPECKGGLILWGKITSEPIAEVEVKKTKKRGGGRC
jgi:hypothetical protein